MRIAAIILAAGESKRMGRDKALLPWPPHSAAQSNGSATTLVSAILRSVLRIADRSFVVTGANHELLRGVINPEVAVIRNPVPERGTFSSLQCGALSALKENIDAAVILHVDRPPVSSATLRLLTGSMMDRDSDACVSIVPSYGGRHGHPYMVSAGTLREFVKAPVTTNARDRMHGLGAVEYVECDDPAITFNLNTPVEYELAAAMLHQG